jgi:hypothetical protein
MKRLSVLTFALVLVLVACNTTQPTSIPPADDSAHLLIVVQGPVNVKRAGRSEYAPGMFGMVLHRGDLLRLDGDAQAKVACADLTLADAASGTGSVPCKMGQGIIADPATGSRVSAARSNIPSDIPIVIAPRRTRILNARPTLRWSPMPGIDTFKVSIQKNDTVWNTDISGQTQVAYPANAPALTTGQTYKVVVQAGERSSEDKLIPDLGFTVAPPNEVSEIREAESKIKALGLAEGPTEYLIAVLYATRKPEVRDNFNAEAIERLENLVASFKEPAVLRMLGDLYLKIGVLSLAEERYVQAVELSKALNDVEGQADELQTLGMIYTLLGNKDEALQHLQEAIALYQKLGDTSAVKAIEAELTKLKGS